MKSLKNKNFKKTEQNKILIIDDDESQLKTLSDILEYNSYMPFTAYSEKEAIEILKKHEINVAILDLRLGESDGITVLNKLKKINPLINVIINTGYASLETAIDAINLNVFAYIKKGGSVDHLLALVNKAFYEYYEKYNITLKKEVYNKTAKLMKVNKKLKDELLVRGKLEDDIVKLNKDLSDRVYKRTEELEAAVKEQESFNYTVSHDLRAPLRHINSYIEILLEEMRDVLTEENKRKMSIISESAKRLGDLIDGLLAFSRMSKNELNYSGIDLNKLLQSIINDFRTEIKDRIIKWDIKEMPKVCADPILLLQVWYNLISNAIKYTKYNKESCIEVGFNDNGISEYVFFIKDNGVGFDMRYVNKLFGVFQRLHVSSEFQGIGIGLANVKRIVARHGGKVWAEGEEGKGAVFYFTLPKKQDV